MTLDNTTNIKDVINALEELEGVNQKTELASVIGLPAVGTETIAQQIVSLISGKQTIVNALNSKDVTADISESIEDLGSKINSITTGVNYASGQVVASSSGSFEIYGGTTKVTSAYIEFIGLNFKPKKITISPEAWSNTSGLTVYYETNANFSEYVVRFSFSQVNSTNGSIHGLKANQETAYVNSDGFRLPVSEVNKTYTWEAYG